mgnify:CR=1 FL=1
MKWNDLIGTNKIGNIIDAIIHKKVEINKYIDILKLNNYDTIVNELSQVNSDVKSLNLSI